MRPTLLPETTFARPRRRSPWLLARASCGTCVAFVVAIGAAASGVAADLSPPMGRPATERHQFQGNQFTRAGNPQCLSPFAKPTESPHETGYFIGGGARTRARHGQQRRVDDGTWGTDYVGILFHKHIELNWWHGSRFQGGGLGYRTVGPRR
ncbi:MAG: hypothetical protein FJ309_15865 [Planctomycetes bacterium]|nr:hypothetical protein [Planctomycetota bacterium]MBM4057586.1 hypothetical protein [Planctomycetota bacterium]